MLTNSGTDVGQRQDAAGRALPHPPACSAPDPQGGSSPAAIAARDNVGYIDQLEDGYRVIQPIPYEIRQASSGFVASMIDGNIAITGNDAQDAYQSLIAEILDTYDTLAAESHLGREAAAQFELLKRYIGRP